MKISRPERSVKNRKRDNIENHSYVTKSRGGKRKGKGRKSTEKGKGSSEKITKKKPKVQLIKGEPNQWVFLGQ